MCGCGSWILCSLLTLDATVCAGNIPAESDVLIKIVYCVQLESDAMASKLTIPGDAIPFLPVRIAVVNGYWFS